MKFIPSSKNHSTLQLLVISPRNGCITRAVLDVVEDVPTESVKRLKLVGFYFGCNHGVGTHIRKVHAKFKRRNWMLFHLRRAGIKGMSLFRLYCCYIRSFIEYCSPVYHSLLNVGQTALLEKMQRAAVRICFGLDIPVKQAMTENGIETLEARRVRREHLILPT